MSGKHKVPKVPEGKTASLKVVPEFNESRRLFNRDLLLTFAGLAFGGSQLLGGSKLLASAGDGKESIAMAKPAPGVVSKELNAYPIVGTTKFKLAFGANEQNITENLFDASAQLRTLGLEAFSVDSFSLSATGNSIAFYIFTPGAIWPICLRLKSITELRNRNINYLNSNLSVIESGTPAIYESGAPSVAIGNGNFAIWEGKSVKFYSPAGGLGGVNFSNALSKIGIGPDSKYAKDYVIELSMDEGYLFVDFVQNGKYALSYRITPSNINEVIQAKLPEKSPDLGQK